MCIWLRWFDVQNGKQNKKKSTCWVFFPSPSSLSCWNQHKLCRVSCNKVKWTLKSLLVIMRHCCVYLKFCKFSNEQKEHCFWEFVYLIKINGLILFSEEYNTLPAFAINHSTILFLSGSWFECIWCNMFVDENSGTTPICSSWENDFSNHHFEWRSFKVDLSVHYIFKF